MTRVLQALDRVEKPADLFGAHDDRKRLRLAAGRDSVVEVPVPPEGDLVEETDGRDRDQDRAGREMPVLGEMELVGPDVVRPEQVRRLAEVAGELGDLLQIRPLRVRREVADLHVLGHALAEWGHGRLPCEISARQAAAPWSRNRGRQKMGKWVRAERDRTRSIRL